MDTMLTITWPLFGIILIGYSACRFNLLNQAEARGVHGFVYYFALPALLCVKVSEMPLSQWLHWPIMGAYYGAGSLVFVIALVLGRLWFHQRPAIVGLQGVAAIYPNVGYIGLPLVLTIFGDSGTAPAVLFFVCDNLVGMILATTLLEADQPHRGRWREVGRKVGVGILRNPMIGAVWVGGMCAALGWELPASVATLGGLLGAAATPGALFALGISLASVARPTTERIGEVALPVVLKLIVHPALVWLVVTYLVSVGPIWRAVAIIEAILPTGLQIFVMAQKYDIAVELTSTTVLVATVFSILTVSIVVGVVAPF